VKKSIHKRQVHTLENQSVDDEEFIVLVRALLDDQTITTITPEVTARMKIRMAQADRINRRAIDGR
jgi:hypothetical protein